MGADSDSDEEPEASDSGEEPESDSDEEPTGAQARDALQNFLSVLKDSGVTIKTSAKKVAVDRGAATVISSRKDVTHNSGYLTDSQFIAQHLDPNLTCLEAAKKLSGVSYQRQADDANRGYWSGLFFFLKSQPEGARIRDIENQACLSSLLMRTVGGMSGAFGV